MRGKNCIEALIGLVQQKGYEQRSKKREQDFTRKRKMTFSEIIYFMLSIVKESTQNALERVFPHLQKENLGMNQQALSLARQKIKGEAFEELFQTRVNGSYQMDRYNRGDRELIIFDRGYPSHKLIKSLSDKAIAYVMRVQQGFIWKQDREGMQDGWVLLGKTGWHVRVMQIPLTGGEREILITNLGEAPMAYQAFGEWYYKRWGIQTTYKALKQKRETENVSGRLVDKVKQDF